MRPRQPANRLKLREKLEKETGVKFGPASAWAIKRLRAIGVPKDALEFYRKTEPKACAEINQVRLWPISHVLVENRDAVPGCYIQPNGYVVFATTIFGDSFCFDTNALQGRTVTPVVLMAHDLDWESMKPDEIAKLAKPIARTLERFVAAYLAGTLDIDPLYPD